MAVLALTPDDPNAAPANRAILEAATGSSTLPQGDIYVDSLPRMTAANNGLSLVGDGTRIRSTRVLGSAVDRGVLGLRPGTDGYACVSARDAAKPAAVATGGVGWLFPTGSESRGNPITPTRLVSGEKVDQSASYEYIQAFNATPYTGRLRMTGMKFTVPQGHGRSVGDILYVTDGPPWNEVVGEFIVVTATTATSISVGVPTKRRYTQPSFIGGPFPARQSYRGITFLGQYGDMFAIQTYGMQFTDCEFDSQLLAEATGTQFLQSSGATFNRCVFRVGLNMSSGSGITFNQCTFYDYLAGQQMQTDVVLRNCTVRGFFDAPWECDRWELYDMDVSGWMGIYDDWKAHRITCAGDVRVRGHRADVRNLQSGGIIYVQAGYLPGVSPLAATRVKMQDVDAVAMYLGTGTSGDLKRIRCPIYTDAPTAANWTLDGEDLTI